MTAGYTELNIKCVGLVDFRMWHLRLSTPPSWNTSSLASSPFFRMERCSFFKKNLHRCVARDKSLSFFLHSANLELLINIQQQQFTLYLCCWNWFWLIGTFNFIKTHPLKRLDIINHILWCWCTQGWILLFKILSCLSAIEEAGAGNHPPHSNKWAPSSTHQEHPVCDVPFPGGMSSNQNI